MFILNSNESNELAIFLQENKWLKQNEKIVEISKPGEGNMNCVFRITTNQRSFIIKQSRDYVEKYPQVAAPANRVFVEATFYDKIKSVNEIQVFMPKILEFDAANNIMILEDLGESKDFTYLYQPKQEILKTELSLTINYLNLLHQSFEGNDYPEILNNREMRKLNHEHIFEYPFMIDNGFDLDNIQSGLQELALVYKNNNELKVKIAKYGNLYLENNNFLLHGDYYPGSWLKTAESVKIIDPEFCFYGLREFDLGVLIAHLHLSEQDEKLINLIENEYIAYKNLDLHILNAFIGIEIMRRIIGLAQLPLTMNIETKKNLLAFAATLIQ